jgi:tetratricopeptide (TPR) repeat protein
MKMNQLDSIQTKTRIDGVSENTPDLCATAKQLEEAGRFQDAQAVLSDVWRGVGFRPNTNGLPASERAELLLRVGTLSGWLGTAEQISGAQEFAKDLISESATLFEQLNLSEKVAEARVDLGVCYWRAGALDEARITFDAALDCLGTVDSQQRLRALLNKALVEEVSARSDEALRILSQAAPLFEVSTNQALKGKFHNEYGTVLKNVGLADNREDYIDRALMQYTAASVELEEAGDLRALGNVENNLGFLHAHQGRFVEAHEHLDRALSLAARSNDKGSCAQFEDTRARAFIREGRLDHAEKSAMVAVRGFRKGDEQSNLAAALTTQGTVLARLGRHGEALSVLVNAVNVAGAAGDRETGGLASITIIEELGSELPREKVLDHYVSAESALEKSQSAAVQLRLGQCARQLLSRAATETRTAMPVNEETGTEASLEEQVLRFEGELIKRALDVSGGSVTRAARLLGVTHQGLAFILNGRQKNLLSARKPAKPRRRSIIRYH